MGTVWRAQHPEGVPVAVKLLQRKFANNDRLLETFRFEVRSVASLDHPSIVRVYDYGVVSAEAAAASEGRIAEGAPWLAMEFAGGGTFAERGPVRSWAELSTHVLHLLEGLAHSHARAIVHRDLKPENVLVRDEGPPTLTDFGIAHALTRHSPTSAAAGTPGYMAPEQVLGRVHDQGPWTDLYAMGALVYALLAGQPPFVGLSRDEVFRQQLHDELPPLTALFDLPDGAGPWLERMLDRDPYRRFRCAADAAHAFATLDAHPVLPPPLPEDWRPPYGPTTERPRGMGLAVFLLRPWPLVGRAALQEQLWQALTEVTSTRKPGALLLEGEAGVGTTRLARWLTERALATGAAEVLWVRHRGRETGLRTALSNHLQLQDLDVSDAAQRLRAWLKRQDDDDPDLRSMQFAEWLAPDATGDPAVGLDLIRRLAHERPLILVVDDLHQAGEALDLIPALLDADLPGLVVTTCNPDLLQAPQAEAIDTLRTRTAVLRVTPLPDGLQRELVDKGAGLSARLAKELVARTYGNPLFAVHAVTDWARQGLLMPTSGGFDLRRAASPAVPRSIRDGFAARLDPLATAHPRARDALELLATLGGERIRETDWLAAASTARVTVDANVMTALLDRRVARTSARPGRPRRWTLSHPLLRDVLMQRAGDAERLVAWHRAAGHALVAQARPSAQDRGLRHLLEADERPLALDTTERLLGDRSTPMARRRALLRFAETLMDQLQLAADHPRRALLADLAARTPTLPSTKRRRPVARTELIPYANPAPADLRRPSDPTPTVASVAGPVPSPNAGPGKRAEPIATIVQVEYVEGSEPDIDPDTYDDDAAAAPGTELGERPALEPVALASGRTSDPDDADVPSEPSDTADVDDATRWLRRGDTLRRRGHVSEARPWLTRAQTAFETLGEARRVAHIEASLAAVARSEGEGAEAMERARRARDALRDLGEDPSPGRLQVALTQLARRERAQARYLLEPLANAPDVQVAWLASGALLACVVDEPAVWDRYLAQTVEQQTLVPNMELDAIWPIESAAAQMARSGDLDRAREAFALAAQRYRELGDETGEQRVRSRMAQLAE